MKACSEDIITMIEEGSNLGLIAGQNMFIGKMPTEPNICVVFVDTEGYGADIALDNQTVYEHASVQMQVRGTDYTDAYNLAENISTFLRNMRAQYIHEETLYSAIIPTSLPALLNWDENDRVYFVINFDTQRR